MTALRNASPAQVDVAKPKSVVVGTAGHIDHGKTALVLALTGTDTDRLPEEKSRGITIDLGFAALALKDANGRTLDLSLIDVPGHHAFIRNMVAGAGGIDCVMLVIAADEGVKAQTAEHLAICTLLGIRRGLVVLTKRDVVREERLRAAREEVAGLVKQTFLEGAPVIAVSALTGEDMPALHEALACMASDVPERSTDFVTRLPLDRAFSMRGFGTVVTGTLQSGTLRVGEALELQPEGRPVRVRGVQVHGQARSEAQAPGRVALNVVGIEAKQVNRGDVIVPAGALAPVSTLDVELTLLPGAAALRHRSRVRVHAFTAETLATLLLFQPDATANASTVLARLRLVKPMILVPGDRFVLRQPSPAITLAGGRVLDAYPLPHLRKPAAHAWLQAMQRADGMRQISLRVERRGIAGTSVTELVAEMGLTAEAIRRISDPLLASGQLIGGAGVEDLIEPQALSTAERLLLAELNRAASGAVSRAELCSRTRLKEWVFELALKRLHASKRIEVSNDGLSMPGRASAVSQEQSRQLAAIEALYVAAGLASPILSEVSAKLGMDPKRLPGLITLLLRAKRLVRMGADNLFIHADVLERLKVDLQRHRGESFDVPRFKTFTNLTRKHAIPLLEYLDGARVTRNSNGTRIVC